MSKSAELVQALEKMAARVGAVFVPNVAKIRAYDAANGSSSKPIGTRCRCICTEAGRGSRAG